MWELPAFQQPMTFGLYPNAYGAGSAIQQIVLQAGDLLVTLKKKGLRDKPANPCPIWSGREDLNLRPLDPQSSTLTRLRYVPNLDDPGMCAGML